MKIRPAGADPCFKLISNFLPDGVKSAEIIEYFESRGSPTKNPIAAPFLDAEEFLCQISSSHVVLAIDETNKNLEGLIARTIDAFEPEHIFLPLCEERKQSLFMSETEDREILESRIKQISQIRVFQVPKLCVS